MKDVKCGGYPTEYGLKQIRKWRIGTDADICNRKAVEAFIDLIHSMWWTPEWGFTERLRKGKIYLELHTGGWSGNEEIIGELKKTFFWFFYWQMSKRGGHYWFEVDLKAFKPKVVGVPKDNNKTNVPRRLHAKQRHLVRVIP